MEPLDTKEGTLHAEASLRRSSSRFKEKKPTMETRRG